MLNKKLFFLMLIFFCSTIFFSQTIMVSATCPDGATSSSKLCNPLSVSSPQVFIGTVIKGLLGVTGSIALLMFIYGGFTWMISRGEAAGTKKGLDAMLWATIGLIVIFSSYALVSFVFTTLNKS
jgi:hypothetical protein